MRRLPATAVALAVVLAVPATAGEQRTRIVDRTWKVKHDRGHPGRRVEPGGTYRHCPGDHVVVLVFRGRMVHPSKKGAGYVLEFRHDGEYEGELSSGTREGGWIRQTYGHESPYGNSGFGDGKWTFRFLRKGEPIAKTSITLKTVAGPAC